MKLPRSKSHFRKSKIGNSKSKMVGNLHYRIRVRLWWS
jgi:hypothetical protein